MTWLSLVVFCFFGLCSAGNVVADPVPPSPVVSRPTLASPPVAKPPPVIVHPVPASPPVATGPVLALPPKVSQPVPPPPPPTFRPGSIQCDATQHLVAECRVPCPPERTCQNRNGPEPPCVPPTDPCTMQCVCADGYARNQWGGYCVTNAQCDQCPGNQYFTCDGPYSENCSGSCHCTEGYARDANNTCVSTTPPPVIDPNVKPPPPPIQLEPGAGPSVTGPVCPTEMSCDNATRHEIPGCVYGCPPERTCQNRNWPPLPCAPPAFPCTPKCICDDGYARNQPNNGDCITFEQCDLCPGENEYFQCDGENEEDCIGHCYCYSGYTRDINDTCIYVEPASKPLPEPIPDPDVICDATQHEISACTFGCPPERSCQNRKWPPPSCAPPAPWLKCTKKCICADGYVRNEPSGVCVKESQYDKCPGENEYFQCDSGNEEDCTGHCYCLSNHVRDIDGKCVYVDPASPPGVLVPPATTTEKPEPQVPVSCDNATRHEVPSCVYVCPRERTCQSRNWPHTTCPPPSLIHCKERCVCDAGYIRNRPNGDCVTQEQCDLCSGDNEYFQCDGEYDEDCDGHCYCLSNYVRDIDGNCVFVDPASPPGVLVPPTTETPQVKPVQPDVKPEQSVQLESCDPEPEFVTFYNL